MTTDAAVMSGPAQRFRDCVLAGDVAGAVSLFAADCSFHSPVVHQVYEGRDALSVILHAVVQVFEEFRYDAEFGATNSGHVLLFSARIGDRDLQGVDILTVADGRLIDLTVMIRPYSAVTALRERMAALLTG